MHVVYKLIFNDRISNNTKPYYYIGSKSFCKVENGVIYDKNNKPYYGSCKSTLFLNSLSVETNIVAEILYSDENYKNCLEMERIFHIENNVVKSTLFFNQAIATIATYSNPDYMTMMNIETKKICRLHKDEIDDNWVGVSTGRKWYNDGNINRTFFDYDVPIGWNVGRLGVFTGNNFTKNISQEELSNKIAKTRKENGNYIAYNKGTSGVVKHSQDTKNKMSLNRIGKKINNTVYEWIHPDHGIVKMTQYELYNTYNLSQSMICMVANKKRKSYKKWKLFDKD